MSGPAFIDAQGDVYLPTCVSHEHAWHGVPTRHYELARTNVAVHNTDMHELEPEPTLFDLDNVVDQLAAIGSSYDRKPHNFGSGEGVNSRLTEKTTGDLGG